MLQWNWVPWSQWQKWNFRVVEDGGTITSTWTKTLNSEFHVSTLRQRIQPNQAFWCIFLERISLEFTLIHAVHTPDNRIWWGTVTFGTKTVSSYCFSGSCCDITLIYEPGDNKRQWGDGSWGDLVSVYATTAYSAVIERLWCRVKLLSYTAGESFSAKRDSQRLEGLNLSASHVSAQISSSTPFPPAPLSWNERSSRVEHFIDVIPYRASNQALGLEPQPYLPCNLQGRGTLSKLPWKLILHACSQLDIHSLHSSFFLLYTI